MLVAIDNLPFKDEVPLVELPHEKLWSENYCFFGHDYQSNVGLYLHIGRWAQDPTIWREQVYIYLPDGTSLSYRSLGRGDCSEGPVGALLRMKCREPGKRWEVEYEGPTIHTDPRMLLSGPLRESILQKMDLRIRFEGLGPPMMYHIADNTTIGRWHYEQEIALDGIVHFGGREYPIRGYGWRDHTRGPRYLTRLRGHVNTSGRLPDGTFFSCFVLWEEHDGVERQVVSEGRLIKDSKFTAAEVVEFSRLTSLDQYDDDIKLTLQSADRRIALIGRPLNLVVISCNETFEFIYGTGPELAPLTTFNQPVRYMWGEEVVGGHSERSIWLKPPQST
jgi:hypothetical protein